MVLIDEDCDVRFDDDLDDVCVFEDLMVKHGGKKLFESDGFNALSKFANDLSVSCMMAFPKAANRINVEIRVVNWIFEVG